MKKYIYILYALTIANSVCLIEVGNFIAKQADFDKVIAEGIHDVAEIMKLQATPGPLTAEERDARPPAEAPFSDQVKP